MYKVVPRPLKLYLVWTFNHKRKTRFCIRIRRLKSTLKITLGQKPSQFGKVNTKMPTSKKFQSLDNPKEFLEKILLSNVKSNYPIRFHLVKSF